jgi:hypothetical protein
MPMPPLAFEDDIGQYRRWPVRDRRRLLSGTNASEAVRSAGGREAKSLRGRVPEARVELARGCPRRILSPLRLPFRHSGAREM